jgi:midasin (ATPase involved in ribosome maturation)
MSSDHDGSSTQLQSFNIIRPDVVRQNNFLENEFFDKVDECEKELNNNFISHNTSVSLWNKIIIHTSNLSTELCEQLRLILSPTHASRAKGEFRTGLFSFLISIIISIK